MFSLFESGMLAKHAVVLVGFALLFLVLSITYGRKLDALICNEHGEPSAQKIGVLVAGAAWTDYMLVNRPDSVEMWAFYYCAVAATDLFKKALIMWFRFKSGSAPASKEPT